MDLFNVALGGGFLQLRQFIDIGAAAEALAVAGQHADPQAGAALELLQFGKQRFQERGAEGISFLGAVEEDARDSFPDPQLDHMASLSAAAREALKKVSTATLTTVLFKRGFRNVFIQGVFPLNRNAPRMVGEAYTLRYIPAREDLDLLGAFEGRGHPQREAIEACPSGHVLVMDARRDASAATGGDILMTRLM